MNPYLIIIPTYNEVLTIEKTVRAIANEQMAVDVLVVDDTSPDGTADVVKALQKEFSFLRLLINSEKEGLAHAYKIGFAYALEKQYSYICEMDADFSHDPTYLKALFKAVEMHDFAVGSRYVKGGNVKNWSIARRMVSRGGSLYARLMLASPFRDQTGGFNIWRREVLETIMPKLQSRGYVFQVELKYRARQAGFSGIEVPILFKDRTAGESKMNASIIKEALFNVLALRFPRHVIEFVLFSCVGATGMIINLALFWLLADVYTAPPTAAGIICFVVTVLSNYTLNHFITFQTRTGKKNISARAALRYMTVALMGLGINLAILNLILHLYPMRYAVFAQATGILGGMAFNFFGASRFVFKKEMKAT